MSHGVLLLSGQSSTNAQSRRASALRNVGRTVGERWTLVGVIGSGGTATVYEAVHRNGSRVAVKVLRPDWISNDRVRRRFLGEGYAANLVRHDGAVKVLDDGETDEGGAYLVMELLEGETLAARLLRDGPLPSDQVRAWGSAVLEILASAHEHHVVHRDVKPSNIFITRRGQVKLLDFGIARISADSAGERLVTQQDSALGTPAFMAPEQATGSLEQIGPATDIWGVGATLFQLLTGRPIQYPRGSAPFPAEANFVAPPVRAFAPNLSPELAKVIDRALSPRTSDRWPTARAMIGALDLAREPPLNPSAANAETLTEEAPTVAKPVWNFRRDVALAALGFLLTLAGGLYWALPALSASPKHPVVRAAVAASRETPALVAPTMPSLETAVTPAVPSASASVVSASARHERAPAGVPRRKASGVVALSPATKARATPTETRDLDSLLDRRK